MKTKQVSKDSKLDISSLSAIPPCYRNIDNKAEVISFWSDDEKVSRFMEKRKRQLKNKSLKLEFCSECRWDKECVGIDEDIIDKIQKHQLSKKGFSGLECGKRYRSGRLMTHKEGTK